MRQYPSKTAQMLTFGRYEKNLATIKTWPELGNAIYNAYLKFKHVICNFEVPQGET